MAHANGFPPATYLPLATMLAETYHVVGLGARPLWPGSSPREIKTWHVLVDDLLEGLEALQGDGVVGVGHSLGGLTTLLAAVRRPDLFRVVVFLDPVLLPPRWLALVRWVRRLLLPWRSPLAKGALRRRRVWPDRDAAYEYFKGKPLFASWHDAALRAYVEFGTRPTADGQVELVYPPEWEAHLFDTVPTDVWRFVPRLSASLPALFLRGECSTVFRPQVQARVARLLPHARCAVVPQAGHMFPLERPAETAARIRAFLS
jgi:pimeloyl-ACP methyl ester carboxylesterase